MKDTPPLKETSEICDVAQVTIASGAVRPLGLRESVSTGVLRAIGGEPPSISEARFPDAATSLIPPQAEIADEPALASAGTAPSRGPRAQGREGRHRRPSACAGSSMSHSTAGSFSGSRASAHTRPSCLASKSPTTRERRNTGGFWQEEFQRNLRTRPPAPTRRPAPACQARDGACAVSAAAQSRTSSVHLRQPDQTRRDRARDGPF